MGFGFFFYCVFEVTVFFFLYLPLFTHLLILQQASFVKSAFLFLTHRGTIKLCEDKHKINRRETANRAGSVFW